MKKELRKLLTLGLILLNVFTAGCKIEPERDLDPVIGDHCNDKPINFGSGEVIIKGENLLLTEWNGVTGKVVSVLNTNPNDEGWADWFAGLIKKYGANFTIIAKYTEDFANYKTTRKGNIIYINSGIINNNDDALFKALGNAFAATDNDPSVDIIGRATTRETVRMARMLNQVDVNAIAEQALTARQQSQIAAMHREMGITRA
ncbi:MAG: hypothetical protein FWD91_03405 [Treponema sp.]|nr:hypothetical protein [Treponema sp.]